MRFLVLILALSWASAEIPVQKIGNGPPAENEYILWLNKDTPLTQLTSSDEFAQLKEKFHMSVLNEYSIGKLNGAHIKGDLGIQEVLAEHSLVMNIAPNFRLYGSGVLNQVMEEECIEEEDAPNGQKWDLTRISARETPDYNRGIYRYSSYEQGDGVYVYVLDSGINTGHVSFGGRASHGFTAPGLESDEGNDDLHGHGSHVAGLVAGDVYGTAKMANVIAVKVLNSENWGYYSWWTQGLQYVISDYKAKKEQEGCQAKCVVNMSLGGTRGGESFEPSIREAIAEGCVFVVAGMNEADDACNYTPAFMPEVITVGATNQNDLMTSWSNYGSCVDFLAPGQTILSAYRGSSTATTYMSGTSMATPLTAGVIARNIGARYGMPSNDEIKAELLETATFGAIGNAGDKNTPNYLAFAECGTVEPPCDGDCQC